MNKYTLILASSSPRRKELLSWHKIPFQVCPVNIDEISNEKVPSEIVIDLAKQKGETLFKAFECYDNFKKDFFPIVVAADTLVFLGNKIMGQPGNKENAKSMLLELSNKRHQVYTGVYIGMMNIDSLTFKQKLFYVSTDVYFEKISEDLLDNYLDSEDSIDKAGAYGIQGEALNFISRIDGSYSNVVGFPLNHYIKSLKELLDVTDDNSREWRQLFHTDPQKIKY